MRFAFVILLLILANPLYAQDLTLTPFDWAAAGITLEYPQNWDEPFPIEASNPAELQIAQVLADAASEVRPPAIPVIKLTLYANSEPADGNLLPFLFPALQSLGIDTFDQPATATFLDSPAAELIGTSADSQFFGVGRVALLDDAVLVMIGRSLNASQGEFLATFDAVATSVRASVSAASGTDYGVLWHTQRSLDDGDEALVELIGLAYGPGNILYTYERVLGLVQLEAQTGAILNITPNENIVNPTALTVASDGTVYIADSDCGCIFTYTPDGLWLDQEVSDESPESGLITGFGLDAPQQLVAAPDNTLFATNVTSEGTISVVRFEGGRRIDEFMLDTTLSQQPLLTVDTTGQPVALTQFGELLAIGPTDVTELSALGQVSDQVTALALTATGDMAFATSDQGILIISQAGDFIAQPGIIVAQAPLPGEMVAPAGVAFNPQGVLYFMDSDGTFGALTALSTSVAADRLGASTLLPNQAVQGRLDTDTPQQTWTYAGTAGERITITALDNSGFDLDLALRLMAPDGSEAAINDDHESLDILNPTDAQIADFTLSTTGTYNIVVEQVEGTGGYTLGVSPTRAIALDTNGVTTITGRLEPVFAATILEFNGSAGQTLTITLETTSGDLDPLLRLNDPDGNELAFNDDADDTTLGSDAQLLDIVLSLDGPYQLEAARFDGSGSYALTIVVVG